MEIGSEAYALVKASSVIISLPEVGQLSARNRLCGEVARVTHGAVNTDVVIQLDQATTLSATVTNESAEGLDLPPGSKACALFKSSRVILGVPP